MRRFLIRVACFFLLQGLIAAAVLRNPLMESRYMSAVRDKYSLLLHQESPRVVFLGGSSVAFGTDSEAILQATGLRPVNMALHAQLGIRFMLEQVKPGLRTGDVVILSFEYELFGPRADHGILAEAIFYRPADLRCLGFSEARLILDSGLRMFCRAASSYYRGLRGDRRARGPYSRDSFNAFGDVVAHRMMPRPEIPPAEPAEAREAEARSSVSMRESIRALDDFLEFCRQRGIRVAYFFPAISRARPASAASVSELARGLEDALPGLTFLNQPAEMIYSEELFFDTTYHLHGDGITKRTELLVARMREWLRTSDSRANPATEELGQ